MLPNGVTCEDHLGVVKGVLCRGGFLRKVAPIKEDTRMVVE